MERGEELAICGPPLVVSAGWLRGAATSQVHTG